MKGYANAKMENKEYVISYEWIFKIVMPFSMCHTPYTVLWRLGGRLELSRSASVPLSPGSTIKGSSSSSTLWKVEVVCCLSGPVLPNRSQYVVVDGWGTNWLTWCQECVSEVFWELPNVSTANRSIFMSFYITWKIRFCN